MKLEEIKEKYRNFVIEVEIRKEEMLKGVEIVVNN